MLLRLQNYDVTIQYQPGKMLLLADRLSRLPGPKPSVEMMLDVAINLVHFRQESVQELRDKTARDPILTPLRDLIVSGWPDSFKQVTKPLRPYWSYRDELSIEYGIILKGSEQVLIPAAMQEYILDAGHQGRDKCQLRAKRSVFWNGINDDIAKWVATCPISQKASSQRKEPLVQSKKTFRHEHGTQSAQISLTSWDKNTCLWLTTFQSSPLSSACPGTVAAKQPRRP